MPRPSLVRYLTSWLGGPVTRRSAPPPPSLRGEALEPREMPGAILAVDANFSPIFNMFESGFSPPPMPPAMNMYYSPPTPMFPPPQAPVPINSGMPPMSMPPMYGTGGPPMLPMYGVPVAPPPSGPDMGMPMFPPGRRLRVATRPLPWPECRCHGSCPRAPANRPPTR